VANTIVNTLDNSIKNLCADVLTEGVSSIVKKQVDFKPPYLPSFTVNPSPLHSSFHYVTELLIGNL
jgi:hypothetical protein